MKFLKFDYETFFIDIPHSTAPIGLRQRPFSAFGGAHWSKTAPFPAFGGAQLVYNGAPFPHLVAPIWSLTTPAFGGALLSTTTPAFDGALFSTTTPVFGGALWSSKTPAFGGALWSSITPAFGGALWSSTASFGPRRRLFEITFVVNSP